MEVYPWRSAHGVYMEVCTWRSAHGVHMAYTWRSGAHGTSGIYAHMHTWHICTHAHMAHMHICTHGTSGTAEGNSVRIAPARAITALNDAARVAEAQFRLAYLPWDT